MEYIRSFPYPQKEMLMLGYKATVKKADFRLSGEVDSAAWVKYEDALDKLREAIGWEDREIVPKKILSFPGKRCILVKLTVFPNHTKQGNG